MNIRRYLVATAIVTLLIACGDNGNQRENGGTGDKYKAKEGILSKQQLKALEKAKGVEDMIMGADAKRRKEMDDSGL